MTLLSILIAPIAGALLASFGLWIIACDSMPFLVRIMLYSLFAALCLHDPRVHHHRLNGKLCALADRARRYAIAQALNAAFSTVFSFNHGILTNFLAFHQIRRTK